jgi:hypothetical protein
MAVNGNIFELFDVGLYEGTVAPPFMVPDYASELQACKRYWQSGFIAIESTAAGAGVIGSAVINYGPPPRATPTITYGTPVANSNNGGPNATTTSTYVSIQITSTTNGRSFYYNTIISNARM